MDNKTKEIRGGAWCTSNSETKKPYVSQIEKAYRTIEADSKKDADAYMKTIYQNSQHTVMGNTYEVSVEKSHGKQKGNNGRTEYFYIITRRKISEQ